jgi:4-alpha-glucanotransferase
MQTALRELARSYFIQLSYEDAAGKRRQASPDSLRAMLDLRVPGGVTNVEDALRARQEEFCRRVVEPVVVVWGRGRMRLPAGHCEIILESGERVETTGTHAPPLPFGYHTLRVDGVHEAVIFAAPIKAPWPKNARSWGIFAPVYAMRTNETWGAGDIGDLQRYREWVNELGGGIVATLPMAAAFMDDDPSPYSPVSRLFWNELYLDIRKLPEYRGEPFEQLPDAGRIDYKRVVAAKRRLLETLAARFEPDDAFRDFARHANDYAEFRARREADRAGNDDGGESACAMPFADAHDKRVRYHLYVQYRMAEQMRAVADDAKRGGPGLYLDFPLGVNPNGYDAWRYREHFAKGVSVGSPPDLFFTRGQNWGFPPLDPDAIRARHHSYFRACVRQQLAHAGILRIDHVMGLHRLFWIPNGAEAKDGVYVRYPEDELYAVLTIEATRADCVVVGEDLGTVPEYVPNIMHKRGIRRMYVVQYEIKPDADTPIGAPSPQSIASINTHDMPSFAGFWSGRDIDDRIEQSLLDDRGAERERTTRARMRDSLTNFLKARGLLSNDESDTMAVLDALVRFLGSSEAEMVLVNLEDLWLEREPQNVPGIPDRSWRQRFRVPLEEARAGNAITAILSALDHSRRMADGNKT